MMLPVELSNKLRRKIEGMAEGGFKALLSAIPFFTSIVGAWDGLQNARDAEFIKELAEKIESIDEKKIDDEFIMTDEFLDLIVKAIQVRRQHRSRLKAHYVVGLIGESMCKERDPQFSTEIKEKFLNILDEMTDSELLFLIDFTNGKYSEKSRNNIYQEKDDSVIIALDGLLAQRIIQDQDTWNKNLEFSILGRQFITYMKILKFEL